MRKDDIPVLSGIQLQGLCFIEEWNVATAVFLIKGMALRTAI